MKFMLRQIKAMDFTLPDADDKPKAPRQSVWRERAALSTKDEHGKDIPASELDIALLVLYGHILYSGNSFYPALNYFFRAYALDDQNPVVLLSIALCFIHHSHKRQCDNRHYLIMQGLSFMHDYRRVRAKRGATLQERQEVEFNFARVWHGLNLSHLAVEGYERVLQIGEEIQQQALKQPKGSRDDADVDMDGASGSAVTSSQNFVEDFSREAAFALQCLHVFGGDTGTAKDVTEKWLVI
jgi:general transcription factor 3C polypeptide 3 (transcription factor C subunit 4)